MKIARVVEIPAGLTLDLIPADRGMAKEKRVGYEIPSEWFLQDVRGRFLSYNQFVPATKDRT